MDTVAAKVIKKHNTNPRKSDNALKVMVGIIIYLLNLVANRWIKYSGNARLLLYSGGTINDL